MNHKRTVSRWRELSLAPPTWSSLCRFLAAAAVRKKKRLKWTLCTTKQQTHPETSWRMQWSNEQLKETFFRSCWRRKGYHHPKFTAQDRNILLPLNTPSRLSINTHLSYSCSDAIKDWSPWATASSLIKMWQTQKDLLLLLFSVQAPFTSYYDVIKLNKNDVAI